MAARIRKQSLQETLEDINVKAAIAFALAIIAFALVYIAFLK